MFYIQTQNTLRTLFERLSILVYGQLMCTVFGVQTTCKGLFKTFLSFHPKSKGTKWFLFSGSKTQKQTKSLTYSERVKSWWTVDRHTLKQLSLSLCSIKKKKASASLHIVYVQVIITIYQPFIIISGDKRRPYQCVPLFLLFEIIVIFIFYLVR